MSFPLRQRTQGVLVRVVDRAYTHSEMSTLFLEAEVAPWERGTDGTKQQRIRRLLGQLEADGTPAAEQAILTLVQMVLAKGTPESEYQQAAVWLPELTSALAADGLDWDLQSRRLVPTVPGMPVVDETSWTEHALDARSWSVAAGHYRQALDAFADGRWASANGQLRSLLEELLPLVAEARSGKRPANAPAAIQSLQNSGDLVKGEFGFAKGIWEMCQTNGSHPGLSDAEEARFRLLTVTAYARYLLDRLP